MSPWKRTNFSNSYQQHACILISQSSSLRVVVVTNLNCILQSVPLYYKRALEFHQSTSPNTLLLDGYNKLDSFSMQIFTASFSSHASRNLVVIKIRIYKSSCTLERIKITQDWQDYNNYWLDLFQIANFLFCKLHLLFMQKRPHAINPWWPWLEGMTVVLKGNSQE